MGLIFGWHGSRLRGANQEGLENQSSIMRIVISTLAGIVAASVCSCLLAALTSMGPILLAACGVLVAALAGYVAHGHRVTRRMCMALRIVLGRLRAHARPGQWSSPAALVAGARHARRTRGDRRASRLRATMAANPAAEEECVHRTGVARLHAFVGTIRARLGRPNPMWISYAALACWACYEVVAVTHRGGAPLEMAASAAASELDSQVDSAAAASPVLSEDAPAMPVHDGGIAGLDADDAVPAVLLADVEDDLRETIAATTGLVAPRKKRVDRDPCQGHIGRCNSVLERFLARGKNNEL